MNESAKSGEYLLAMVHLQVLLLKTTTMTNTSSHTTTSQSYKFPHITLFSLEHTVSLLFLFSFYFWDRYSLVYINFKSWRRSPYYLLLHLHIIVYIISKYCWSSCSTLRTRGCLWRGYLSWTLLNQQTQKQLPSQTELALVNHRHYLREKIRHK